MSSADTTSQASSRKILDMLFGALVMGTVGTLLGLLMGGGVLPIAFGIGLVMGTVVGLFGGRRFLVSILIGTLLGGILAWLLAGAEKISVGYLHPCLQKVNPHRCGLSSSS